MTKPKSTIALDDFELAEAKRQLAAMKSRQQAVAILSVAKPPPERPERKLSPPKLAMKNVVDNEATGNAFRRYREGLGLTLDAVAEASFLSPSTLNMLEIGKWPWDAKRQKRVSKGIFTLVAERGSAVPQ